MNRRKFLKVLGHLLASPVFLSCSLCFADTVRANGVGPIKGPDLLIKEKMMDFKAVKLGDHIKNPCTPQMDKGVTGIKINAPGKVQLKSDPFAICGTYYFPASYVYSFPRIHQAIVLVAVDASSHKPYACNLTIPGSIPEIDAPYTPPKDPDWMENHFIQRYFNIDLSRFMRDLPMVSSTYYIYALIENHISNVCKVDFTI